MNEKKLNAVIALGMFGGCDVLADELTEQLKVYAERMQGTGLYTELLESAPDWEKAVDLDEQMIQQGLKLIEDYLISEGV